MRCIFSAVRVLVCYLAIALLYVLSLIFFIAYYRELYHEIIYFLRLTLKHFLLDFPSILLFIFATIPHNLLYHPFFSYGWRSYGYGEEQPVKTFYLTAERIPSTPAVLFHV